MRLPKNQLGYSVDCYRLQDKVCDDMIDKEQKRIRIMFHRTYIKHIINIIMESFFTEEEQLIINIKYFPETKLTDRAKIKYLSNKLNKTMIEINNIEKELLKEFKELLKVYFNINREAINV